MVMMNDDENISCKEHLIQMILMTLLYGVNVKDLILLLKIMLMTLFIFLVLLICYADECKNIFICIVLYSLFQHF